MAVETARPATLVPAQTALLLAVVLTAFNLRTAVTGFTVLTTEAGDRLGFGPVVAGAIGTIVTACFAASAFVVPSLVRRLGLERTAAVAAGLATLGMLLRAVAWSPAVLVLGTVVTMAGIGGANVVLIPIIRQHFAGSVGSMSTAYMVLLQIGQLVAPLVATALVGPFGWRVAAGVWAVLTAAALGLWVVVVRHRAGPRSAPEARAAAPVVHPAVPWRLPLFWGLVGLMAMTTLHVYTLVTWLPTMFEEAGLSAGASAGLLSWFAGLGIIAAFVVPPLTLRMRNPFPIVVVCAVLLAIGYAGMAADTRGGAVWWALAFGLGVSTFPLCLTLIGARASDAGMSATLSGTVQGIGYGVGCVGPITLGVLNQAAGSWHGAYAILGASLAVTLVAGWVACRPVSDATPVAPAR